MAPDKEKGRETMVDQTTDLLNGLVRAFNDHDLDTAYAHLHDDYREYLNGTLVKQSRSEARLADQPFYDTMPDYRREVDELIVNGPAAAMRWRFLGTGPDGPLEVPWVTIWHVQDGEVVECWVYGDVSLASATLDRAFDQT
jgi:predicted ester cyclase